MKIVVCQIAPKVGALEKNYSTILQKYRMSQQCNAHICVFPELSITGYLAGDLFLQKDFIKTTECYTKKIIIQTSGTCLLLPTILYKENFLYNVVIAAQNKEIIGITYKSEIPNYGIFDERRYFIPGTPNIITVNGIKIGVPICEDIWHSTTCIDLKNQGAELLIVPNASPYEKNKLKNRIKLVRTRYQDTLLPIIYCNQAMSHDGIVFDGKSFVYDHNKVKIIGKSFQTDTIEIQYTNNRFLTSLSYLDSHNLYQDMLDATTLGLREYVKDNGFKKVIIGLSGGIDSAIVTYIAVQALGYNNVLCYMLPSKFTSRDSIDDAILLAKNLNVSLGYVSIQHIVDQFTEVMSNITNIDQESITYQNFQSRARGTVLMGIANELKALLLTTGNKSEYATGYATIYGDMNGAFNPIKDIYKTEIFEFAKYINIQCEIIPKNIIAKSPSAELSLDQKDSDVLPQYHILDQVLYQLIENKADPTSLYSQFNQKVVDNIYGLLKNSEFKRSQSALGVKISNMHFDKDRRFPITNFYSSPFKKVHT